MIKIIMYNEKWRLIIGDDYGREEFEFKTLEAMQLVLKDILRMKDSFGRLR